MDGNERGSTDIIGPEETIDLTGVATQSETQYAAVVALPGTTDWPPRPENVTGLHTITYFNENQSPTN